MHGAIVQRNGALFVCQEHFLHGSREPQNPWGSFSSGITTAVGSGGDFPRGGGISISNEELCWKTYSKEE